MFNVSKNGIVSVTRGDSFQIPLFINQGTELKPIRYELTGDDTIYFALMEPNQRFECALLKKVFTKEDLNANGDIVIKFSPKDTENILPGSYYYQVKVKFNKLDGTYEVNTIVPKTQFIIEE